MSGKLVILGLSDLIGLGWVGERYLEAFVTDEELEKRFTYHPPKGDQPQRYEALRAETNRLASLVLRFCPDSRERSLALTKLEEAVMWANAAIARNE